MCVVLVSIKIYSTRFVYNIFITVDGKARFPSGVYAMGGISVSLSV